MLYDEKGNLTRAGMEAAIGAGGSFTYQGRIISSFEAIPPIEELAKTDADKSAVASELDRQIAELQARRASITSPDATPPKSDPQPETYGDDKYPLSYFKNMTDEEIDDVKGIGPSTVKVIRDALNKLEQK